MLMLYVFLHLCLVCRRSNDRLPLLSCINKMQAFFCVDYCTEADLYQLCITIVCITTFYVLFKERQSQIEVIYMIVLLLLLQNYNPDDAPSFTEPDGKHYHVKCSLCIQYTTPTMRSIHMHKTGAENAKNMHIPQKRILGVHEMLEEQRSMMQLQVFCNLILN